ncbi:MAG: hypothetical protein ACMXYA_01885 [Candidatus Woesearchaeota archaeon]
MKKGVIGLVSIVSMSTVYANTESIIIYSILGLHSFLLCALCIILYKIYRAYQPEVFKPITKEIADEKKAHAKHYSEHTVEILHRYISYYTRHGFDVNHLRKELEKQGYAKNDITEALNRYGRKII